MALHEQSVGATDEWYTPAHVFDAMGTVFDLDVASPGRLRTPWVPARNFIDAAANAFDYPWAGFVWMNPPFGGRNGITPWLEKFFAHGDGVALVPDRTSAPWWQAYAPRADRLMFVAEKLKFLTPDPVLGSRKLKDGTRVPQPAPGYPGLFIGSQPAQGTTLLAVGELGVAAVERAASAGLGSTFTYARAA